MGASYEQRYASYICISWGRIMNSTNSTPKHTSSDEPGMGGVPRTPKTTSSSIPFRRGDGEVPLWATERKQLPSGEWVITVWLGTENSRLSHNIHVAIKDTVNHMMSAGATAESPKQGESLNLEGEK